jgi:hypothetical protein
MLTMIELKLHRIPHLFVIQIAENEHRFHDLAQGGERPMGRLRKAASRQEHSLIPRNNSEKGWHDASPSTEPRVKLEGEMDAELTPDRPRNECCAGSEEAYGMAKCSRARNIAAEVVPVVELPE